MRAKVDEQRLVEEGLAELRRAPAFFLDRMDAALDEGPHAGRDIEVLSDNFVSAAMQLWLSTVRDGDRVRELREMRYADFLASPEWAFTRKLALRRAGHRCQGCNDSDNLEVHHRTYERRGEEAPGDLTVLCSGCHTAVHLVADGRRGTIRKQSKRARL